MFFSKAIAPYFCHYSTKHTTALFQRFFHLATSAVFREAFLLQTFQLLVSVLDAANAGAAESAADKRQSEGYTFKISNWFRKLFL